MKMPKREIGFIGLGRMGKHMVLRLLKSKHKVIVWNRSKSKVDEVVKKGAIAAKNPEDLVKKLKGKPKIVWLMLPSGKVTSDMIKLVSSKLKKGDILIDGGNANFHDSISRSKALQKKGIQFMDVGTSGGLVAATKGYCMMIGGPKEAYDYAESVFAGMCVKNGYGYMGPGGAGHYVKMVHNSIEYGMMQAMAEGFDLLKNGRFEDLDLKTVTNVWNHGSIIESFLMQMAANALSKDGHLAYLEPYVDDTGEGRWAAFEAMEFSVPFTVNTHALYTRYSSRDKDSFAHKMLAALRNEFGGHAIKGSKK